jgi:hypothetical protein
MLFCVPLSVLFWQGGGAVRAVTWQVMGYIGCIPHGYPLQGSPSISLSPRPLMGYVMVWAQNKEFCDFGKVQSLV